MSNWDELAKIAPPEKWLEMYKDYNDMLTTEDVSGWWQEQFLICNEHRKSLQAKINELELRLSYYE